MPCNQLCMRRTTRNTIEQSQQRVAGLILSRRLPKNYRESSNLIHGSKNGEERLFRFVSMKRRCLKMIKTMQQLSIRWGRFSKISENVLKSYVSQASITNALQPYGLLPISTNSSRTQQLLYHCKCHAPWRFSSHTFLADNTGFIVNAFAINFDDTWKPFSVTDSALLHATICLVAQHEDLLRGLDDSSENLYHKGEVMRLMNSRLLDHSYSITDADITSVALLVILEVSPLYLAAGWVLIYEY